MKQFSNMNHNQTHRFYWRALLALCMGALLTVGVAGFCLVGERGVGRAATHNVSSAAHRWRSHHGGRRFLQHALCDLRRGDGRNLLVERGRYGYKLRDYRLSKQRARRCDFSNCNGWDFYCVVGRYDEQRAKRIARHAFLTTMRRSFGRDDWQ